jgi:hypothetical protein
MEKEVLNILSSLKPLCYDLQKYNALLSYLEMKVKREQSQLEHATDPIQIHRSQGKIQALRSLMKLREEVLGSE